MEENIFKGLVSFVKNNSDITLVFQGLQNRVALPNQDCAIITFINKSIKSTPVSEIDFDESEETIGSQVFSTYQLDVYGENSYDNISRLRTLFSHEKNIKHFKNYGFAPIISTNVRNLTGSTIINEEYFKRYSIDLTISYRDDTSIDIEFIDEINITTQEVAYGIVNE